ncbi:hypothetical protein J6590_094841 [Homalodisca vitripennis]|nr:hypothetical protein J6590_094841 [Homalodisca vitripennis]
MRLTGFKIYENNSLHQMLTEKCTVCKKHERNRVNYQNDEIENRKANQNLEVKFIGSLNETDSDTMEEEENSSRTEYDDEERESEEEVEDDCGEDAEEVFVEHERQERELEETIEDEESIRRTEYEEEVREIEEEVEDDCGADAEEVFVEHERQERELEETIEDEESIRRTEYEEEVREIEEEVEDDCGADAEEVFVEHERQERELEELEVLRVRHKNAGRSSVERKRGGLEEEWCDIEVTSSTPHYHTGYGVGVKPFRPGY